MRIKSIAQICKSGNRIVIIDHHGEGGQITQWIGDGIGMYPVYDMPMLTKESACTILDIEKDKRDNFLFTHTAVTLSGRGINLGDADDDEMILARPPFAITYLGARYAHALNDRGLMLYDAGYMAPLRDVKAVIELYERVTPGGMRYIAVKAGLLILAVIMPSGIINQDMVDMMRSMTNRYDEELTRKRVREGLRGQDAAAEQMGMEDEEG